MTRLREGVTVVVPCYRSEATLRELVGRLIASLAAAAPAFEIILVADESPSATADLCLSLSSEIKDVRAVVLRRNYGQHNALVAGIVRGQHEITVTMDDDLQHHPESIVQMLKALEEPPVDLVYGNPIVEEHGALRSGASKLVKVALSLSGVPNARQVSAFRAFRTELREGFLETGDPFINLDVLLSWSTTSVVAVEVPMSPRRFGRSNYTIFKLMRHAWNMVTGYSTAPLRVVTWLGALTSLLGLALLISVLVKFLFGDIAVAGFTTVASMLAILCGTLMICLGVIGEYLGRLHFRSMRQPIYVVRKDSGSTVA